jgi:hypothetical protein
LAIGPPLLGHAPAKPANPGNFGCEFEGQDATDRFAIRVAGIGLASQGLEAFDGLRSKQGSREELAARGGRVGS